MKRFVFVWAALLVVSFSSASEHTSPGQIDQWMTFYYLDPKPSEVPAALREIAAKGYFENDNVQAPLSGFFAQVFRSNPAMLDEWVKPYVGIPNRHILYSALWMANSVQGRAALERLAKGAAPKEANHLRELISSPPPSIGSMSVNSPAALDYLWGSFMASGLEAPVLRIIDQIKLANIKGDVTRMMIGGAAQWSVSANARQHEKVHGIVKARALTAEPETRAVLQEILSDIEAERLKK